MTIEQRLMDLKHNNLVLSFRLLQPAAVLLEEDSLEALLAHLTNARGMENELLLGWHLGCAEMMLRRMIDARTSDDR